MAHDVGDEVRVAVFDELVVHLGDEVTRDVAYTPAAADELLQSAELAVGKRGLPDAPRRGQKVNVDAGTPSGTRWMTALSAMNGRSNARPLKVTSAFERA